MKLCVFFVGQVQDTGFNACALLGAERIAALPSVDVEILGGFPFEHEAMLAALNDAAGRNPAVIFIGGQGNKVVPEIASKHPDCSFAVVQGEVTGPNIASYEILQEQSAFLAGCLAARLTKSGTVGHLSGHRVAPGLKGRAAFVAGVNYIDPNIDVLTGFCGTQDDTAISGKWADAQIADGVDVLFTMLNAARQGVTDACRAANIRQIGNVFDWCRSDPSIFVGSALASIDLAVERAARDIIDQHLPSQVQMFGLSDSAAVSLSTSTQVFDDIAEELAVIRRDIIAEKVSIPANYTGPEFEI